MAPSIRDEFVRRSRTTCITRSPFAWIDAGLQQREKTLDWLTQACDERLKSLLFVLRDPLPAEFSQVDRFRELLRRTGLELETRQAP